MGLGLVGVDGNCLGSSPPTVPLPVPLCGLVSTGLGSTGLVSTGLGFSGLGSSSLGSSSSFFSVGRVLEEEVPVEALLELLTGRAWVEGGSVCLGGSTTGGFLSTVLGSFTGTTKSGAFRAGGAG